jgi:hypothetical protein
MQRRADLRKRTMHFQEGVLRKLFRVGAIAGESQRQREYPCLVLAYQLRERNL